MRETVRSLRIYLVLCGTLTTVIHLANLAKLVSSGGAPLALLLTGSGFLTAASLLYAGFRLRHLLKNQASRLYAILYANMAFVGLVLVLVLPGGDPFSIGQLGIGLLILWYIRSNARRLSNEVATPPQSAAA